MKAIRYYVDKSELLDDTAHLMGWALSMDGVPLQITVTETKGAAVEAVVRALSRPDACLAVWGDERQPDCGFDVRFPCEAGRRYHLILESGTHKISIPVRYEQLKKESGRRFVSFRKMVRMTTPAMFFDDIRFLFSRGPSALRERLSRRYETDDNKYMRWLSEHRRAWQEEGGGKTLFGGEKNLAHTFPTVSIVVPIYNTPVKFYEQMLQSCLQQSYENWQLCLADGSTDNVDRGKYLPEDSRICYRKLSGNLGIAGNSNEALSLAEGQWIALLDHDDILESSALAEMVEYALKTGADLVYSDEDKVSPDLKHYYEPHFKPDFNPDLLRSNNYICHLLMAKRELFAKVGGFLGEYDGAQDYDLILRLSEQAVKIAHLPRVLYHWRTHPASTAENPDSKPYAVQAGQRALQAHLERTGLHGTAKSTNRAGYYRVRYAVTGHPKISILIPNKDQADLLSACIESIEKNTDWPDYEILVVENNSTTEEIRRYYKELERDERVRILTWDGAFNYSAINNFGVSHSTGDYVVLLNNDTTVITPDWLSEMAGICSRPEVGVVGAKLFYPDDTIQHAGVVMKLAGCCGHIFYGAQREDPGRYARASVIQDFSAVTAACLMCRREVWERLGGLSTDFQVAYNDVDFCLRAREAGYLVVYTPYAQLYHYESRTRGYEDGSEKQARFLREQQLLRERYPEYQEKGDPCYNPNLTLIAPDFSGRYLHDGQ